MTYPKELDWNEAKEATKKDTQGSDLKDKPPRDLPGHFYPGVGFKGIKTNDPA